MAITSYDSPASLRPDIDYKPNGFLGGMLFGQRQNDYRQSLEQSNLMKALSAKQEMQKMAEYDQNAPVRENERLSKIAGFQNDVKYKGDIMAGQAAQGRSQVKMIGPEQEAKLAEWKAKRSEEQQKEDARQMNQMELIGETLFNTPGHDTMEGQMERDKLLKQFKQRYPELQLPDTWNQQAEEKMFQNYSIAKTYKSLSAKQEMAKAQMQKEADYQKAQLETESRERIAREGTASKERIAEEASARVKGFEVEMAKILAVPMARRTPEQKAHLAELQRERDIALASKLGALGVTTGVMGSGSVTPGQIGADAASIIRGARGDTSGDLAAEAQDAINKGADPEKVKERYKKLTGKDL